MLPLSNAVNTSCDMDGHKISIYSGLLGLNKSLKLIEDDLDAVLRQPTVILKCLVNKYENKGVMIYGQHWEFRTKQCVEVVGQCDCAG